MSGSSRKTRRRKKRLTLKRLLMTLVILLLLMAIYILYDKYIKKDTPSTSDPVTTGQTPATTPQQDTDSGSPGGEIPTPSGMVRVHYIDVGQGDASLIVAPNGQTMLIDAGENNKKAAAYLKTMGISTIDYLVFTHFDSDHIGGGVSVLEATEVKNVLTPDPERSKSNQTIQKLMTAIKNEGSNLIHPEFGDSYKMGDLDAKVLSSSQIIDNGANDDSIILLLSFGENTFLFSGDAEKKREQMTVDACINELDADVFQAGHHGASNANNDFFLKKVTPEIVVISCGLNNKYGHPTAAALDRFDDYTDRIYRTDLMGTIIIYSDGHDLTVTQEKAVTP